MSRRSTFLTLLLLVVVLVLLTSWMYWALNRIEKAMKPDAVSSQPHSFTNSI